MNMPLKGVITWLPPESLHTTVLERMLMKHSDLRPAAGAEGLIVFQLWQPLTVILVGNVLGTGTGGEKNKMFLLQFTEFKDHVIVL